ncbi:hypothetical protein [Nonomuraea sp. NPDC049625]|uniref:hypothetical protein n=1 Tax=Nonomuraea sp. NPDC049625 TaxID=3155775 RepID=UPI0034428A60
MAITTPEKTADKTISAAIDAAPVMAPDGPGTVPPDADPTAGVDARAAAVWAALNAQPGASATIIGAAADLSRMVAGKILNQFEADGQARREPGGQDAQTRGRTPDRWYAVTGETPDTAPDAEASLAEDDADLASALDGEAVTDTTETADAIPADEDEPTDDGPAEEPDGHTDETNGGTVSVVPTDASEATSEPVAAEDPAWTQARTELIELVNLLGRVVTEKDTHDDTVVALGCLEMAVAKVASVHRNARAVLTGIVAAPARATSARPSGGVGGGVRPGALRDRVHAHLIEFPGKDFTPYEIARVLDASSGAVANALDRLVNLGHAVLTCERPRRFALAPTAEAPAPTEPGDTDTTGTDSYGD